MIMVKYLTKSLTMTYCDPDEISHDICSHEIQGVLDALASLELVMRVTGVTNFS